MKVIPFALLVAPLVAASAPAQPEAEPLQQALRQAQAEQAAAEAETAKLQTQAAAARTEADRLRTEEAAAARAIDAAEARITVADAQYRLAAAYVAAHQAALAQQQRPVSSLLAGLAVMGSRPPLLALADGGGADELVKVSVLLDATLPVIRNRTRAVAAQLAQGQRLQTQALSARAELAKSRNELGARRQQFSALEEKAFERSLAAGGQALGSGDVAIAAGEQLQQLHGEEASGRSARALASLLAAEGAAPASPFAPTGPEERAPFPYALPVRAPVLQGLGAVDDSGVRSRGTSFATSRGAPVSAPAAGVVRFAGPFRNYDGVVIIDHGGGWLSLIVNVSTTLGAGGKVALGEPLGRALGPVEIELSHNGQRFSPALIAGSSAPLSNAMKGG